MAPVPVLAVDGWCVSAFYDWYCDLPPAFPEIWGEQTDVAESADGFKPSLLLWWF